MEMVDFLGECSHTARWVMDEDKLNEFLQYKEQKYRHYSERAKGPEKKASGRKDSLGPPVEKAK